jgi:hypothetical protein
MSFQIILDTTTVFATNTAGKDYTWAFRTDFIEEGDYEMTFQYSAGNIALATFATNGPVVMSIDMGLLGASYAAGATNITMPTQVVGALRLDWRSATVGTYIANRQDNYPVIVKDLRKASNFIRVHLDTVTGALITTGITPWIVILHFTKIN